MCGRFALYSPAEMLKKHFGIAAEEFSCRPRYNIGPGQAIDVVRYAAVAGRYEFRPMVWGLIPFWAKEKKVGSALINARAETLDKKPAFKKSFQQSRCLIPANGFYEWKKIEDAKKKQPYFICREDGGLLAFAGLWSVWEDKKEGRTFETCAIITTRPNSLLAEIHDRMPVILPPTKYEEWLRLQDDIDLLKSLLVPHDATKLKCYPVSDRCNIVQNDIPACIEPIKKGSQLSITW